MHVHREGDPVNRGPCAYQHEAPDPWVLRCQVGRESRSEASPNYNNVFRGNMTAVNEMLKRRLDVCIDMGLAGAPTSAVSASAVLVATNLDTQGR